MKRLKTLLIVFVLLLIPVIADALGTVVITYQNATIDGIVKARIVTLSWTADASAATVPSTTVAANVVGWYLYSAETNPGAPAPTDNYDIVLNDADGLDIAGGLLTNRDTATTEMVNFGFTPHGYPIIRGNLTFVLSNNAVNLATGTLILIFTKD